ncbi:MAG: glycosyltransferase family 39 protein, partial [Planctomycetota bacterium]|nr:glycosyltransferase family 39 protein [Planctomycetota bacterium]
MSETASGGNNRRGLAFLALVIVLPLSLRLAPIGHGLPRNYIPDTHLVKNSLGMARDRDPVPEVGEYSTYPNLLPYILLPVYAAHYGLGLATERWSDAAEYGEVLLANPGEVHLLARLLLALMGAAVPWVLYRAARRAGLGGGAYGAAFLGATALLAIQFSTQERPWGALVLATALACWGTISYLEGGRGRSLIMAGVAAGLAFACHQAGLGILALAGFAYLLGPGASSASWAGIFSPR